MGLQETFIGSVLNCQNPDFAWPGINEGLPNVLLSTFLATMGGVNYLLDFIPPSPTNLPSPPSIDIFLNPFLASMNLPSVHPGFSLGPINIPAVGVGPPPFDPTGMFKLVYCVVMLPFKLITSIITGIVENLSITLPTVEIVLGVLVQLAADVGLSGLAITRLFGCLAHAMVDLLTSVIPV